MVVYGPFKPNHLTSAFSSNFFHDLGISRDYVRRLWTTVQETCMDLGYGGTVEPMELELVRLKVWSGIIRSHENNREVDT